MRKVRIESPYTVTVVEAPEPAGRPGEVALKIRLVGICGSDQLKYTGRYPSPLYPVTPGHEFSAEVQTDGFRVVVNPNLPCRACRYCREGRSYLCERLATLGAKGVDGAMQERLWVPRPNLIPLDSSADEQNLVLTEPLAVAVHGVGLLEPGRLLALGLGTIGTLALAYLESAGDAEIDAVDLDVEGIKLPENPRLRRVMSFADFQRARAELRERYDTVLIMCPYDEKLLRAAIDAAARGGCVVCVGLPMGAVSVDFNHLLNKEVEIRQSFKYSEEDFKAAHLFLSAHDLTRYIPVQVFELERAPEAFQFKDRHPRMKVLLDLSRGS
jgi:threonine dehydrogenase-like Zn-dependent dehydrogenase